MQNENVRITGETWMVPDLLPVCHNLLILHPSFSLLNAQL